MIDDNHVWTAALPDGTNGGGELPDCDDWTSNSAGDSGELGVTSETTAGFTVGVQDSCNNSHHLMCIQFQ